MLLTGLLCTGFQFCSNSPGSVARFGVHWIGGEAATSAIPTSYDNALFDPNANNNATESMLANLGERGNLRAPFVSRRL